MKSANRNGARLRSAVGQAFRSPWVVFLVALLLRVGISWQMATSDPHRFYATNEQARIAWALESGHGFSSPWPNTALDPTAQQPPVYPWLLAGIFRLAGPYSVASLRITMFLNAVFAALTAVLMYRIGKDQWGEFVGLLAAWVWACWIYEVVVSSKVWESSLSALWFAAGLWLLGILVRSASWMPWIAFGALAGLAALTNTSLLAVFAAFGVWLLVVHRKQPSVYFPRCAASLAVCIAVLLPWSIRNFVVFHRVIPVRDNFGMELWIGNHEGVTHLYDFSGPFPLRDPAKYNRLGELNFMEAQRALSVQFIGQHPMTFLRLCGQRVLDFWSSPSNTIWAPLSAIAWIGLMLLWRRNRSQAAPYAVTLAIFPLVYYITHTWSTYRHPIEPAILLLAAYALAELARSLGLRRFALRPE